MSRGRYIAVSLLLCLFFSVSIAAGFAAAVTAGDGRSRDNKEFYIVYLGESRPDNGDYAAAAAAHLDVLSSVKGSDEAARESLVYSYTRNFNAFAARLSEDEAHELSNVEQVISVFPNRYHKLHTTKSWDFIGFPQTAASRNLRMQSNVVVGLFDSGITPQSESFCDEGFGPPPSKWKGACTRSANFSGCNNKLIGARYFKLDKRPDPNDIMSPVDVQGHGTHTSSTLAGNIIPGAGLFGLACGIARGAVPGARVAMYKVCWVSSGCSDMDILAAFDAAIHDGVDVISISISGGVTNYTKDSISIGAFHALKMGITTVTSAGNDGPNLVTVANHALWLVTVAASGIDRQFRSKVHLGNGRTMWGVGVDTFEPNQEMYPLVTGEDAGLNTSKEAARFCVENSLDSVKVKGKLVYCKLAMVDADAVVTGSGGVGTIIESPSSLDAAQIFMAPSTMVNVTVGESIYDYIRSTHSPSAVIYRTEEVRIQAPFVASFSSRGPNPGSQRILKPDIAAPGVDILASYTPLKSLTGLKGDNRYAKFTLMSGTSMACPHVAGIAAYVKSFHPSWTPAAIKSAIMTTAKPMSGRKNPEREFAYGSGQLNPVQAANPGLVYDMDEMSYIQFLCREGYPGSSLSVLVGPNRSVNCSSLVSGHGYDSLNYPTIQLTLQNSKKPTVGVFTRTVTNVGPTSSVYNATIRAPKGVKIVVRPARLSFSKALQKRSFKVVVEANPTLKNEIVSGSLAWKSSSHHVRSPIVINGLKFDLNVD